MDDLIGDSIAYRVAMGVRRRKVEALSEARRVQLLNNRFGAIAARVSKRTPLESGVEPSRLLNRVECANMIGGPRSLPYSRRTS